MTNNPDSPAPIEVPVENLFEVAMRGYNKRQVEDYVVWLQDQVRAAQAEAGEHRRQLSLAREELVVSRQQPAPAPVVSRPHEEISERLAQILRLADEEADGKRAAAEADADAIVQEARDEAARLLTAADGEAERLLSTARERAAADVAASEQQARQLLESSTEASSRTLDDARDRASRILSDADARTASITALQDERLTSLVGAHTDAVRRLDQIRVLLATLLAEEAAAGAPDSAVSAAPLPLAGVAITADEVAGSIPRTGTSPSSSSSSSSSVLDTSVADSTEETSTPSGGLALDTPASGIGGALAAAEVPDDLEPDDATAAAEDVAGPKGGSGAHSASAASASGGSASDGSAADDLGATARL